jgi:hypothetical protein
VQFGVRGLTEALQTECYAKAPHVHVACVMPGGVKTGIVRNALFENDSGADKRFQLGADLTADEAAEWILGGVATNDTRILVGYDALCFDMMSRFGGPHKAYDIYAALGREGVTCFDPQQLALTEKQFARVTPMGWLRIAWGGGARFLLWMSPFLLVKPRRHPAFKAAVALAGAYGVKTIASRL